MTIPVKQHSEVTPSHSRDGYLQLAKKAKVIRVVADHWSVDVEQFELSTKDQREAIASAVSTGGRNFTLEANDKDTTHHSANLFMPEYDTVMRELEHANRALKNRKQVERPKSAEFLTLEERETFANPCHAPDTGRFCETHGEGTTFPTQDEVRSLTPTTQAEFDDYRERAEQWEASLTPQERQAVIDYTGSYLFAEINRNAVSNTPDPRVQALDAAIAKAPKLLQPTLVYRTIAVGSPADVQALVQAKFQLGETISLSQPGAFQSTSIEPRYPVLAHTAPFSIMFEIKTNTGAPIGGIAQGGTTRENELLISRDARFKVVAIQENVQFGTKARTNAIGGSLSHYVVVQVEEV